MVNSETDNPSPLTSLALADEAATHALAHRLAATVRGGDVIALYGDLGVGKTSFARAFVRAFLGHDDEEVPSPTFTLVQTYSGPCGTLWHVDAYRLKDPNEVWELGLDEAFPDGVLLIEWPERLGALLPDRRLDLRLTPGTGETARVAHLQDRNGNDWCMRLTMGQEPV